MTNELIITISVTILVAFSGYIAKYLNDLRVTQRKDRLERVNQQLRDLYGPLFSLVKVSTITWKGFKDIYCSRPDFQVVGGIRPQSKETKCIWRHWMKNVFMPLNAEMAKVVLDHSDLLEEEDMPECLLLLSAHVHGYKGIIAAWEEEDYSEHMSLTPFPIKELLPYIEISYQKLKARQAQLLGKLQ